MKFVDVPSTVSLHSLLKNTACKPKPRKQNNIKKRTLDVDESLTHIFRHSDVMIQSYSSSFGDPSTLPSGTNGMNDFYMR